MRSAWRWGVTSGRDPRGAAGDVSFAGGRRADPEDPLGQPDLNRPVVPSARSAPGGRTGAGRRHGEMRSVPQHGARVRARPSPGLRGCQADRPKRAAPRGRQREPGGGRRDAPGFPPTGPIPQEAPFREFTEYILCEVKDLGRTTVSAVFPGPPRPNHAGRARPGTGPHARFRPEAAAHAAGPMRRRARSLAPHATAQERSRPPAPGTHHAPTARIPPSGSEPSCFPTPLPDPLGPTLQLSGYSVVSR